MADWVPGSLLTALGCGAVYAVAPGLLLPAFPVSLRLGFVLWQAAEGEPRRVWKLWKELSSSIWFFAARVPLASRTAWYYHLRPPPHLVKDIDFGSPHHAGRNRLDVHFPGDAGGRHAVVLFVYGGAWSSGDKGMYALVGATLRRHGLVAVIPNYSIYPTGSMAEMVDDVSFAVGWTVQHVAQYGGDPRCIYLVGHSAGGHLALSTVLRRWCDDHNLDLSVVEPVLLALHGLQERSHLVWSPADDPWQATLHNRGRKWGFFETPIMKNPPKTVKILCFGVSYYRHINEPKATSKKSKQKEMRGVGEGHTSRCHYEKRNTHLEMEIVLPLSPTDLTTTQRLPSYATTTWLPPDRRHWGISLCSRR
eukprot:EG_transcript_15814